jgi:hypothetical protein
LRQRPNVLFLTYEELKRDLPGSVRRMAALMGVTLSEAEFDSVVRQASFEHMRSIAHRFDPVTRRGARRSARRGAQRATSRMIRRGQAGASGELLTAEEQQRIDGHCRAELARLACDFPYTEVFAAPVV